MKMTTALRQELASGLVVAAGCYDAFSAQLAQRAGFKAIHMTGLGVEATQLGAPDLGLLSMAEVVQHAGRMAAAVSVPILADIDTGFGGVLNVGRTIKEMERAGIAGVHIEDQAMPKHCPLLAGREVVSREEAVDRLKAALDARTDSEFIIVARTDADTISYDELVDRSNLFLETGADMVMPILMQIEGKSFFQLSGDEQMAWLRRLVGDIQGPVMNMGSSPPSGYTTRDLAEAGYAFTMYAASALGVAANAMSALFTAMLEDGTDEGFIAAYPGPYHDPLQVMRTARLDHYVELERRYSAALSN